MSRIKVTGYMDTDNYDEDQIDLSDPTGLAESAYLAYASGHRALFLEDIEFELES